MNRFTLSSAALCITGLATGSAHTPSTALAEGSAPEREGDYVYTCRLSSLVEEDGETWLQSNCRMRNGRYAATAINLDEHVGNEDGTLVNNGRRFSETCDEITLDGDDGLLAGYCYKRDGDRSGKQSWLHLHVCIENVDGELTWIC